MKHALQYLRSVIFIVQMYLVMAVYGIVAFPFALASRKWASGAVRSYCRYVVWSAGVIAGIKVEQRGTAPTGPVLIAAKHQSFFDIIVIIAAVPRARFIMKKQLIWVPILGQYALRIGCVAVDRGKRGAAISKMKSDVARGQSLPGQLVIFPQGTRVAPGATMPYKVGSGVLYEQLGMPCVPVAVNVGLFWPKRTLYRRPGTAVIEFLPEIAPGLRIKPFMALIESQIEEASNRLMDETGLPR